MTKKDVSVQIYSNGKIATGTVTIPANFKHVCGLMGYGLNPSDYCEMCDAISLASNIARQNIQEQLNDNS